MNVLPVHRAVPPEPTLLDAIANSDGSVQVTWSLPQSNAGRVLAQVSRMDVYYKAKSQPSSLSDTQLPGIYSLPASNQQFAQGTALCAIFLNPHRTSSLWLLHTASKTVLVSEKKTLLLSL